MTVNGEEGRFDGARNGVVVEGKTAFEGLCDRMPAAGVGITDLAGSKAVGGAIGIDWDGADQFEGEVAGAVGDLGQCPVGPTICASYRTEQLEGGSGVVVRVGQVIDGRHRTEQIAAGNDEIPASADRAIDPGVAGAPDIRGAVIELLKIGVDLVQSVRERNGHAICGIQSRIQGVGVLETQFKRCHLYCAFLLDSGVLAGWNNIMTWVYPGGQGGRDKKRAAGRQPFGEWIGGPAGT
ncbi:MAG: hypothetical protein AB7E15_05210 [Azospira sp.]